jgi:antitoxin HicB
MDGSLGPGRPLSSPGADLRRVVIAIAKALKELGRPECVGYLTRLLKKPWPAARVAVANALGSLADAKAAIRLQEAFRDALFNDPDHLEAYAHIVSPLSADDGGSFLITFPDLPGCMSDGATEAVANGRDAFTSVVSALYDTGREIPAPSFRPDTTQPPDASGKLVARVPKSIRARLASRARADGVSLDDLVSTFIAEGLGRRESQA